MGAVIGEILPFALGIAISPVPIIAVILMLFSKRAGSTSVGFLIGWLLGIIVATGIFTAIAGSTAVTGGAPSSGVVVDQDRARRLLLFRSAPGNGAKRKGPRTSRRNGWRRSTISIWSRRSGLAFLLSAINPKNLIMAAGAGVIIGSAGLSVGSEIGVDRGVHGASPARPWPSR